MFGIICILCIVLNILTNVQGNYVNVAHGKTAYTNTNIPANNVLDGSKDSCTTIDTGDDNTPASLTIDLGEFYNIVQVKVYNTYDVTEFQFLGHFDIYYTNENRTVKKCAGYYNGIYIGAMKSFSCIHDSVKYITIQKQKKKVNGSTSPSRMTLCEVSVLGLPDNTSNVALGKRAYTNTDISADNVVDGLTGRDDPCTTVDTGDLNVPASITVDLGGLYNVFKVEIYNTYDEAEAFFLGDYYVRCDHRYTCLSSSDSIAAGGNFTHICVHDSVKYITIEKYSQAYHVSSRMTICEIKVIGILNSTNTITSSAAITSSANNHTVIVASIVSTIIIVLIISLLVASYYRVVLRRRSDDTSPLMSFWSSQIIENPLKVEKI